MEVTFSQLKQKEVINLNDGKNLGKVCDVTFSVPEYKITGLSVTGGKGFRFTRQDVFIPISSVVKIGEDTVLVKLEDKNCPPPEKPDKRPPKHRVDCPPPDCPPRPYDCPPDRRSYDEYE